MYLIVNVWLSSLCDYLSCVAFLCTFVMSNYTVHRRQSWKTDSVINKAAMIHSCWAAENTKQWQADKEEEKLFMAWSFLSSLWLQWGYESRVEIKSAGISYMYISVRVMSVSVQ